MVSFHYNHRRYWAQSNGIYLESKLRGHLRSREAIRGHLKIVQNSKIKRFKNQKSYFKTFWNASKWPLMTSSDLKWPHVTALDPYRSISKKLKKFNFGPGPSQCQFFGFFVDSIHFHTQPKVFLNRVNYALSDESGASQEPPRTPFQIHHFFQKCEFWPKIYGFSKKNFCSKNQHKKLHKYMPSK